MNISGFYIKKELAKRNILLILVFSVTLFVIFNPNKVFAITNNHNNFKTSEYMGCQDITDKAIEIYKKKSEDLINDLKAGNITVMKLIRESLRIGNHHELKGLDKKFTEFGCSVDELNEKLDKNYLKTIEDLRFNQNDLNNIRIK